MSSKHTSDDVLRIVLIVVAVVVLFPFVMMLFAAPMMGMGMMGGYGGMMGGYGGYSPLWGIGMMLLWLVVILGVGYVLYRQFSGGAVPSTDDSALEELRLAYARGDLSDEEFEQRRTKLVRDEET